jgi:hypothetical protein|tara:strand:- start:20 stop:685 length:666 start_codon:yes stop_codon:yes gene_type:complete
MKFHRFAHLDSFEVGVKVGLKVKRGELIGRCGSTGASTASHLHWDIFKNKPRRWGEYVSGMTKTEVKGLYVDPSEYASSKDNIPMKWDHFGYSYLSKIKGSNKGYHPGWDLNYGASWDDYKAEITSPVNGTVVYIGHDGEAGGWGNYLLIKEENDMGKMYDNHYIQDTEDSGAFALVYKGKKHPIVADRAGLAALTVLARGMTYAALPKAEWDKIDVGDNF